MKGIVLADDMTGALDTAVQFVKSDIRIRVVLDGEISGNTDCEIVVVDMRSRHLPAAQAFQRAKRLGREMRERGVPLFYKKTDSALRGNVGAELEGLLKGVGAKTVYFAPAFPELNRVTKNGVHYVDGVPVDQTCFGIDPFEPVTSANIPALIMRQSQLPVRVVGESEAVPAESGREEILVFDAVSDARLREIARQIAALGQRPVVLAGCSGFAKYISAFGELNAACARVPVCVEDKRILIVSGSLNETSCAQIQAAVEAGLDRIVMDEGIKRYGLKQDPHAAKLLESIWTSLELYDGCIIDVGYDGCGRTYSFRDGEKVAKHMGEIVRAILERGFTGTLVVVGGDTLARILAEIGCRRIEPIEEIEPGVVLARGILPGGTLNLVTKSGGIGSRNVFANIRDHLLSYAWNSAAKRERPVERRNGT